MGTSGRAHCLLPATTSSVQGSELEETAFFSTRREKAAARARSGEEIAGNKGMLEVGETCGNRRVAPQPALGAEHRSPRCSSRGLQERGAGGDSQEQTTANDNPALLDPSILILPGAMHLPAPWGCS